MGVRSAFEISDKVGFTAMVTNGGPLGGTPVDDNETPSLGWQFGFAPNDVVGLYVGGNHGANGDQGNKAWSNFFDVVLSVNVDWFTLLFNGDYQQNPTSGGAAGTTFVYGNSLALIFDASDKWSFGLRGEHLSGNQAWQDVGGDGYGKYLTTGTLTVRYKPVEYLVLTLEGRGEWADENIYYSRTSPVDASTDVLLPNKSQNYAVIIGASAHIGN